ncbi:IclR family transcriptional regulator [Salinifilum aidingensis]
MSQSLERGLVVLSELAADPLTLDELADRLGVHKSTAMRLLRTLENHRFVHRVDQHRYRLGSALFGLANQALEDLDVRAAARAELEALGGRTGHAIHLAICEADEVVYIDKVDSSQPVRMYSRIGRRAPLHCTAVGKVLVAGRDRSARAELAHRLEYPALTASTITAPEQFLAELDRVQQQGYAVDDAEHEDFIHCIAAPLRNDRGAVVAAVSVSVPKVLLDRTGLLALVDDLRATARRISTELGWSGT